MNLNQNLMQRYQTIDYTKSQVSEQARTFLLNVYNWMALGLGITGVVAYGMYASNLVILLTSSPVLFYGLLFAQLGIVLGLTFAMKKINSLLAIAAFFLYSGLTGLTFSVLFLVYTGASIASTFFVCAGMFGAVSVFGYVTKMDLSGMKTFLFMGLIGLILASIVNIFLGNEMLYWVISYAGVLIFVGLTAYDTQKIKQMSSEIDGASEEGKKTAVFGALKLYLDFINMFIFLLRILGKRR